MKVTSTHAYSRRTHLQTHALTYKRTHSLTNARTHLKTHALTYKRTHSLTNARTHLQTHVLTYARTHAHYEYLHQHKSYINKRIKRDFNSERHLLFFQKTNKCCNRILCNQGPFFPNSFRLRRVHLNNKNNIC